MAVACGADFTIALTDNSDVWSLGEGEDGQVKVKTGKYVQKLVNDNCNMSNSEL